MTRQRIFPACVLLASAAVAPAATAADTVNASNIVLNPTYALYGVGGYASARHPDEVSGALALCPSGSTKSGSTCVEDNSGYPFSFTWEIIQFDHDSSCSQPTTAGGNYLINVQNALDSCSSSGCNLSAQTLVFYGYKSCTGFFCQWSWVYQTTISTAPSSSSSYEFFLAFPGGNYPPDGILLGRSLQGPTVSDPRWVEVEERCYIP